LKNLKNLQIKVRGEKMQFNIIKKATKIVLCMAVINGLLFSQLYASESSPRPGGGGDTFDLKMIEAGQKAPEFTILDLEDEDYKLSDLIGKKVVFLLFWSIFCQPCQEEIPVIQEMYDKVGKDKIEILAVSLDGDRRKPAIEKFIEKNKLNFTFLMDVFDEESSGFIASDLYGVAGTPTFFIIDKKGFITFNHTGKSTLEELLKNVFDAKPGS
jgi:peroxiredoxin